MHKKVDSAALRQVMGGFATGIAVATARNAELGAFGLTVNSLTSLSLDPPLVLFCVEKTAFLHPHFRRARHFAFNILAAGQERISRHFADRHHNPAPKNMWGAPQDDCPILRGTLGWILCQPHARHEGGDHTIFVGRVVGLHKNAGAKDPLLYFHGRYRDLAAVTSASRR